VNAHLGRIVLHQGERPVRLQPCHVATADVEGLERLLQIRLPGSQLRQRQPGQDARRAAVVAIEEGERMEMVPGDDEGGAGQRLRVFRERREPDPPAIGGVERVFDAREVHAGRAKGQIERSSRLAVDDAKQAYEEHVADHESVEGPVVGRRPAVVRGVRDPARLGVGDEEGLRCVLAALAPVGLEPPFTRGAAVGQADAVVDEGVHALVWILPPGHERVAEEPEAPAIGAGRFEAADRDGVRGVCSEPAFRVRKARMTRGLETEHGPGGRRYGLLGSRHPQPAGREHRAQQQGEREGQMATAAERAGARSSRVVCHRVLRA